MTRQTNIMTRDRSLETRDNEMREEYQMFYTDPFQVPREVYKEDMSYHFARRSVRGMLDNNIETLIKQGWHLVKKLKKDDNDNFDPLGRDPMAKEHYCENDTVLMERDKRITEYRRRKEIQLNNDKINNLPGVYNGYVSSTSNFPVMNRF